MNHTQIGLGTAAIGRPQYINIKDEPDTSPFDKTAFKARGMRLLDHAYQLGIRYFDTAPGYGMAEDLLINWLSTRKDRDLEVATKWGYTYVADFKPDADVHEVKEHSREKLDVQWSRSKKLLPFLTTYQIHSATLETGVLENTAVLMKLAELKKANGLKIGLSSTGANQLEVIKKAFDIAIDGQPLFQVFQVTYNILDQSLATLGPELQADGRRWIIKEALANGRIFPNKGYEHYRPLYNYLAQLGAKYDVGADAIALRFCMDSIHPFAVLSGAARGEHLIENLKADHFVLTDEELDRLKIFQVSQASYWKERSQLSWN